MNVVRIYGSAGNQVLYPLGNDYTNIRIIDVIVTICNKLLQMLLLMMQMEMMLKKAIVQMEI